MAATLVMLGKAWLWIGGAVAALFLTVGIDRIDEDARGSYIFRPLILPGVLMIWPLVLLRWIQIERNGEVTQTRYRPIRRAHSVAAVLMSIAIALVLFFGLNARQDWPATIEPMQLSAGDQG